jgi:hypothetical protein
MRLRHPATPAPVSRRRPSLWRGGILLAALLVPLSSASAIDPIAAAIRATPMATGELGGTQVTIVRGTDLYEGQTITTSETGEVQIVFTDDTHLLVGPNSELVIERYLMRDPNTVSALAVNALGGTFRWISGNSPSESYEFNTPAGTIGFRGTIVDVTVFRLLNRADIMVYDGIVDLCPPTGEECVVLSQSCTIGSLGAATQLIADEAQRQAFAQTEFPYANAQQQRGLVQDFRVDGAENCLQPLSTPAPTPPPPSTSPPAPPTSGTPAPATTPTPGSTPAPSGSGASTPAPTSTPSSTAPPGSGTPTSGTSSTASTGSGAPSGGSTAPASTSHPDNNGLGNGGEGAEGSTELGNPGHGAGGNPHN